MNSASKKVLAIGLDSCDLEYLQCYLPRLPNLKKLLGQGVMNTLRTSAEALDASVWPTFMTGRLPGEHGFYFPFQWRASSLRYQRISDIGMPLKPFWEDLAGQQVRVGVFDVPMMPLPMESSERVQYYHWQSQDEGVAFRFNNTALGQQILKKWGRNPQPYDIPTEKTKGQLERLRQDVIESAGTRGEICTWLLQESDWDLFITCFSEIHRAGHYLCPNPATGELPLDKNDGLIDVYRAVDAAIGNMLTASASLGARVVVFSLHGMGPNNSQVHFVPKILDRLYSDAGKPQRSAWRWLREYLPARLQSGVAGCVSQPVRDWVVNRSFSNGLDWENIPAFSLLSGGQGYLRFNLKGREKRGCLEKDSEQYRQNLQRLKETFLSIKDAYSGKLLVNRVVDIQQTFPGALTNELPDLSVIWNKLPPITRIHIPDLGEIEGRIGTGRGGNHRPRAFYFCDSTVPDSLTRQLTHIKDLPRLFMHFFQNP